LRARRISSPIMPGWRLPRAPLGALPVEEARDRFRNLAALLVTCLLALAVGGGLAYVRVRDSLKDIRFAGLASLLGAQVGAMGLWID
jgi:hypothetical protein